MKQLLVVLIILCAQSVTAQKSANKVYVSTKAPVKINLPEDRELYGGTIFNVTYKGTRFSNTIKGAFEYACKLVEEVIPTTYPINISVEFSNLQDSECLAKVENYPLTGSLASAFPGSDKIYVKRYWHAYYTLPTFKDVEEGNDFFINSIDATIKFASTKNFDYSIDPSKINSTKYDFITVAIQALLKAIGFECNIYENDQKIYKSSPSNQYTTKYFYEDNPSKNYSRATSGKFGFGKWSIVCDKPYKQGISMNYFVDSDDKETAILQYGISKGSYIRYIGKSLQSFFSDCDWDRAIVTGGNTNLGNAKTKNVISFHGINSKVKQNNNIKKTAYYSEDDWSSFCGNKREDCPLGYSVLLKDGSWEKFDEFTDLKDNENYARTVDGYLRLKHITTYNAGLGYVNYKIDYLLYDYVPQKPEASLNSYTFSTDEYSTNHSKRTINKDSSDDEFVDVEIGLKNIEGTKEVLVEQTDSDYPIPYSYIIDSPQEGKFITLMNKKYSSLFKLTYINDNGKTIGDEFTIDLSQDTIQRMPHQVECKYRKRYLSYNIDKCVKDLHYIITNIPNGKSVYSGQLIDTKGTIDLNNLKNGCYSISIYDNSKLLIEKKIFVK